MAISDLADIFLSASALNSSAAIVLHLHEASRSSVAPSGWSVAPCFIQVMRDQVTFRALCSYEMSLLAVPPVQRRERRDSGIGTTDSPISFDTAC